MRKLFVEVGFGWAVRILAFVMLSSLVICYAVMELDLPQRKPGPLFKFVFLKDASYFAFTLGMILSLPPFALLISLCGLRTISNWVYNI